MADALNSEILALVEAGCSTIQVDEPLFARKPAQALAYGIEHLERCFYNVPREVTRRTHICCGYPVEEITSRLKQALEHIDAERLIAAPDCGLAMLDRAVVVAKLRNMVQAAKHVDGFFG